MPASKLPPLSQVLQEKGWTLNPDDFVKDVMRHFLGSQKKWMGTDEELMYHPKIALEFCDQVNQRRMIHSPDSRPMPTHYILRALVHSRKVGLRPKQSRARKRVQ